MPDGVTIRHFFSVIVLFFVKNLTCGGGLRVISRLAPAQSIHRLEQTLFSLAPSGATCHGVV